MTVSALAFFLVAQTPSLSEVLFECPCKNYNSFRDYHPCTLCPSSMLYLLPVDILYILLFNIVWHLCKIASSKKSWNCFIFWSLLNFQHLEVSMAYNWLSLSICWINRCVPLFQQQFLYDWQMCCFSLVLFSAFKIYIFNCLFKSSQNMTNWKHPKLNQLASSHLSIIPSTF